MKKLMLSMAIAASAVFAMPAANSQEYALEEIVVTAQKREQALGDVPLSISALTENTLEGANINQVRLLTEATPKITHASNFGTFASVFSGRGLSASTNFDPVISSYVDETAYAYIGQGWAPSSNLYDLQRVEITSGPQGTLWGQGAMAGTIRLITNDPDTSELYGNIELDAATISDGEESFAYHGMVNLPLVEDKLAARIVYSKTDEGGYLDYPNHSPSPKKDGNDAEFEDLRVKVLWTPTDNLSIKGTYWQSEVDAPNPNRITVDNPPSGPLTGDRRSDETLNATGVGTTESDVFSVTINYDFDNFSITNTYSDLEAEQVQVALSGGIDGFADPTSDTQSNELRLTSNFDGPFNFTLGHYYLDGDTTASIRVRLFGAGADFFAGLFGIPGAPFTLDNRLFFGWDRWEMSSEVSAFFGEATLELFDGKIELLAGIREFEDKRTYIQFSDVPFVEGDGFLTLTPHTKETFDSTNPRFNIAYRPNDDVMIYFNAAKGFRSGNFNPGIAVNAAAVAGITADVRAIDPDELMSYDLGIKGDFADGLLSAEVIYFQSEWKDAQQGVGLPGTGFFTTLLNVGDMDIDGFEYNVTWRPTAALSFNLQGSYIDSEWQNLIFPLEQVSLLQVGGEGLGVPEHQIFFSATYDRPVTLLGRELDFTAHAAYQYHDEKTDAFGNRDQVTGLGNGADSYDRINLRFTLAAQESWEASLYVDNLTDEKDIISVAFGTIGTPQIPRRIGVTFKKYF